VILVRALFVDCATEASKLTHYYLSVASSALLLALCCTSCGQPHAWAPPPQVTLPSGPETASAIANGERLLVAMSDADANAHILSDVFAGLDGAEFRFTGLHPQFLVQADNVGNLDFYMRFFNHDEALRARGPVSCTVAINGRSFRTPPFDARGDQEYRWTLPDGWLAKPGPIEISLDIEPPWRQRDGKDYGVLLHSVGFERRQAQPAGRATSPRLWPAITQVTAILFAAAFTFVVSLLLGKTLLKRLRIRLYRSEELFFGFVLGAACLSMIVFCLSMLHLAYTWVFLVAGCAIIAIGWKYRATQFTADKLPSLSRGWAFLFTAVYGVFAALYFVVALCPESSVDGTTYHVALPALYLREHRIPAISTNLLSTLSQGMEMLFLFAFSFGKHSAAAMVHLLFTLATPLGILSYARRMGSPVAGAVAGLLFFLSPATGFVGTAAYVDVAAAAVVFAVFYLIQIWREQQQDALLIPVGILSGFAYAIKYTAFLAVVYAAGVVIVQWWRTARSRAQVGRPPVRGSVPDVLRRPIAIVGLCAFAMIVPWLAKNIVSVGNPVAPLANRIFANPNISPAIEQSYVAETGSLGGLHAWEWPYDITARGSHTQGFIGPVFLLAPLALLALATPMGRQLLAAAGLFLLPYAFAAPARYLLPALTFVALALGLVFARWKYVAAGVVVLHAILSWPQVIAQYALLFGAPGPRLEMPDLRAALRVMPEPDYLEEHVYGEERVNGYGIGRVLDANVGPRNRVLGFHAFQQAYHSREVLVEWESEEGVRLGSSVRAAIDPLYQPTDLHRFSFAPRAVQRIRLLQTGRARIIDQWTVSEMRVFRSGKELPRGTEWRLRASPNPWDVQLAFDNSPLTRWASREPALPGMYIEIDFGHTETIDQVTAESTPGQSGIQMDLQVEKAPGEWQSAGARHEVAKTAAPLRLRRAAIESLLRHNVQWLVVNEMDPGARDFLLHQPLWGIKLAGSSERYRLYHLDPSAAKPVNLSSAFSTIAPLQLEGFYDLEQGRFRWTRQNFAVTFDKLNRPDVGTTRLTLSLYIPESTIQKLGPLRLTARLGDHVLAPGTYRQSGGYMFERDLPTTWLTAGPNRFEFALDKSIPPSATDRRELGIVVNDVLLHH
jgi:4-amino-4-deoxy-L-arabinose transferase-like glycosyltransferase